MQNQFNLTIMFKTSILALFYCFFVPLSIGIPINSIFAQITVAPTFPTVDDNITVTYDATAGNAALAGVAPIYTHTGVITTASTSSSDWKYTKYPWTTNAADNVLTSLGNNKHSIAYNIRSYYGIPPSGVTVNQLAMVFRNADGSKVGKTSSDGDIFYDVWDGTTFVSKITAPSVPNITVNIGDAVSFQGETPVNAASMVLRLNGSFVKSSSGSKVMTHTFTATNPGLNTVTFAANDGNIAASLKTFTFFAMPNVTVENPPTTLKPGATDNGDGTVTFMLRTPSGGKTFAYLLGSWNNFTHDNASLMKRSSDGTFFWQTVSGFTAGQTYTYQFNVDGTRAADPMSHLILDPTNDQYISSTVFPNKPTYPSGASGFVTVYEHQKPAYNWQVTNFNRPFKASLVVYELLVRDFTTQRSFQSIIDSIQYLKRLGVNAVEFMPVQEFSGNDSWGYNPIFYSALDKAYGTADKFKQLIDLCHQNGMAVILDVTFNHIDGTSPLCQLYWDAAASKPTANNPWVNRDSKHPFSPAPDLNHESGWTKEYVKAAFKYWLDEFHVDGFRLDLSKGFSQNNNCSGNQFDVSCWSQYDASRVAILKDYNSYIQSQAPGLYVILEHLGGAQEEQELASNGMMLWEKLHTNYKQAAMAWSTDSGLDAASPKSTSVRNWDNYDRPVTYAVSHDEERLMVECLTSGNQITGYSTRDMSTALKRQELIAAFLYTIPGAKMMWMFDELGFHHSINSYGGRTSAKPPFLGVLSDPERLRLFKVCANIINLRTQYPSVFNTDNHNPYDLSGSTWYHKHFHLSPASGAFWVTIVGNFDVVSQTLPAYFQHTGTWYDYLSGQAVNVSATNMTFNLQPGEYHIYVNQQLPAPPEGYTPWGAAIPVELVSFTGSVINQNDAKLQWQTATELNNAYFAVERSFDGQNFVEIGQVKGSGTSNQTHQYTFIDRNLPQSVAYYRLRQIDNDGKQSLSNAISLRFDKAKHTIAVFPNPTTDKIFIQNYENTEGGVLMDNLGRIITQYPQLPHEISISHLPFGIYILKIGNQNFKIVKQ
ncbi:MAG: T9SS type A sorting domain-containing protein [Saprospiraceae bacterium]|nr:T9SS type A sorting domain-containing protein [Saprospiraceae bacterium]